MALAMVVNWPKLISEEGEAYTEEFEDGIDEARHVVFDVVRNYSCCFE